MHRRILLAILLAVAVTGGLLGVPLGLTAWELVQSWSKEDTVGRAQRIADNLDRHIEAGEPIDLERVRLLVPQDGYLTVIGPDEVEYRYGDALAEDDAIVESVNLGGDGEVTLAIPAAPVRTRQTQATLAVLFIAVLSVGTGMVVAGVTARRLARPLRHLSARAARLGGGDFRPDPRRYSVTELDQVADALDKSAEALRSLVRRERQFVGDVSHQLRSRLTALQLRLDSLTTTDGAESAEDALAAQEQADQLATALEELLAAARAAQEAGAQSVDLSAELRSIAADWRQMLQADGRTLKVRITRGLVVRVTPARLREVISVLLDNAQTHGSGTVSLIARPGESEGTVVVSVSDHGPGVPDALVPHIFDRGVSGAGSTGVGLALARALVEADGGRLELATQRPATFSVYLLVPKPTDLMATRVTVTRVPR